MGKPIIRTSYESKRGCGFRKAGGLYLVSGVIGEPCAALPVPFEVCPTCHAGVKPVRSWTWIIPKVLLDLPRGPHAPEGQYSRCPLSQLDGLGLGERAGLLWIGEAFYKTPGEFTAEAMRLGVSRRISAVAKDFKVGETWVLLAHRMAIELPYAADAADRGEPAPYAAGVFHAFRPTAIEYVVKGTETEEELLAIEKRGISLVNVVPVEDPAKVSA